MANDLNKVIIIGRLTKDVELKQVGNTNLCKFTIASNRKYGEKEEVGYFDCLCFGKLGEIITKFAHKGSRVCIDGGLRYSTWDNSEGKRQSKVEIYVHNFQLLDRKKSDPKSDAGSFSEPFNDDMPY